MRRLLISAAFAAMAIAASVVPSQAVTINPGGTWPMFSVAGGSAQGGTYESGALSNGSFDQRYNFVLGSNAYVQTATAETSAGDEYLKLTSLALYTSGGTLVASGNEFVPGKLFFETKNLLAAGSYYLRVMGQVFDNTFPEIARYGGSLFVSFLPPRGTSETPLPGALVLMGSVLLGATGYSGLRKRRQAAV